MNSVFKNALVWVVLGSALIFVFNNIDNGSSAQREMVTYSQFKQEVLSDNISSITYKGDQMTIFGERLDGTRFETRHPIYKRDESVDLAIESMALLLFLKLLNSLLSGLSCLLVHSLFYCYWEFSFSL